MKNKLEVIVIIFRIEWCWLFIKVWQKRTKKCLNNGGVYSTDRLIDLYKHLCRYCDKAILLNYNYKKLTSIESDSMEVEKVKIR